MKDCSECDVLNSIERLGSTAKANSEQGVREENTTIALQVQKCMGKWCCDERGFRGENRQ